MNRFLLTLKRPLVRLSRIRHSCGFGVHSPFAFDLLTYVVYQRTPYYKYKELAAEERRLAVQKGRSWLCESRKLRRLLFRLVNEVQPDTVVDFGPPAASSLYLKAGCLKSDYTAAADLSELFLETDVPVDFLYLHCYEHPQQVSEAFEVCARRARRKSLFVVAGIGYTSAMHRLWKQMQEDSRTGISFDLFDVGLLFFDKTKDKQHYLVNF